jgi:hypothetical protein
VAWIGCTSSEDSTLKLYYALIVGGVGLMGWSIITLAVLHR